MKKKLLFFFRRLILLVSLSMIAFTALSYSTEIDSLARLVATQENSTEKADNMYRLAMKYLGNNHDSAFHYASMALELSSELNYAEGRVDAIYALCTVHYYQGDYNSSIRYIKEYLLTCDSLQDERRIAKGYFKYGSLLKEIGMMDSSLACLDRSLSYALKRKDTIGMIAVANAMGSAYSDIQIYDSAAYYYDFAVDLCEKTGRERNLGILYGNLGSIYYENGQYEDARHYYMQSVKIKRKYKDLYNLAITISRLGSVSLELDELDEAMRYYLQADSLYKQLDDQSGIHNIITNIALIYEKQEKYTLAIRQYEKVIPYYDKQHDAEGMLVARMNKAANHMALGEYRQAIALLDTALLLSYESDELYHRKDIFNNLSEVYYDLKDYKQSADYTDSCYLVKETIFDLEKTKAINNLKLKYEKEKDQARILALENENLEKDLELSIETNQKNIYLFTGSGIIIIILFLFIFLRHRARKEKIIAVQKIRQLEEEKKVLAAKALVEGQEEERKRIARELHDGLGVLLSATKMQFSSIKDKSPENKQLIDKATELLDQATGDVRKISHNMMPGLLTRYGLAEAVEDLFERLDETEGLSAVTEIAAQEERLPENQEIMFYRIIQELVNNTLKHAEAKNIKLKTQMLPGQLEVIYTDDGKGFVVEEKLESRSIGLQSIQSRVNFLNGKLVIESKPGAGVKYIIHIPV